MADLFTVNECSPGSNGRTATFHGKIGIVENMANDGVYKIFPRGSIIVISVKGTKGSTPGLPKWIPENLGSWTHQLPGKTISPLAILETVSE